MRRDCPQRQGSRGLGTVQSQSAEGHEQIQFVSLYSSMGQRDQSPSTSQTSHIGQSQSAGRGLGQEFRPRVQVRLGRGSVTIAASLGI